MSNQEIKAVRQVLKEAGNSPHFFDLSDGERLNWMIARAFSLGVRHKSKYTKKTGGYRHERPNGR